VSCRWRRLFTVRIAHETQCHSCPPPESEEAVRSKTLTTFELQSPRLSLTHERECLRTSALHGTESLVLLRTIALPHCQLGRMAPPKKSLNAAG
jgi:hypothetical protein